MADIVFSDITDGLTTGSGYFDVLMRSAKAHIQLEYDAGRIKGPDYSNVYLGAMQSAMQLAEQFVLAAKLQETQILDIEKGIALKTQQIEDMQYAQAIKLLELQSRVVADLYTNKSIDILPAMVKDSEASVAALYAKALAYTN